MIVSPGIARFRRIAHATILGSLLIAAIAAFVWLPVARTRQVDVSMTDDASLLDGFRHVEVASVSDALEQLTGRKMYMSHHMRPIFPTKFAGFAVTVLLKKEANHDPNALDGMLAAIDRGSSSSVYVMVVEDGADIAGMGGLMGTAMNARNFSGAVIDGGVRDVAALEAHGFPVFSATIALTGATKDKPGTVGAPVRVGGVLVSAGDWVVADVDGVTFVPGAELESVLAAGRAREAKEAGFFEALRDGRTTVELLGLDASLIREGSA